MCVGRPLPDMHTIITLTWCKVTELLKFQKLLLSVSVFSAILAWSSRLIVDMIIWDLVYSLSEPDFSISFPISYHVTSNFTNVDITGLSRGHISVLLDPRVTWSGVLVVLYVLCMLMWPWLSPRSRSCSDDRQPLLGPLFCERTFWNKWHRFFVAHMAFLSPNRVRTLKEVLSCCCWLKDMKIASCVQ